MVRNGKFSRSERGVTSNTKYRFLPAKWVTAVCELKRAAHKEAMFTITNIGQILPADKSNCILYNVVRCKQGC